MQIVYHMRVHGTDDDRMVKSLLMNRDWLHQNDTEVLTPNRLRGVLDESLAALQGGSATPAMEQIMLDAILESDHPERVICSIPGFIGAMSKVVAPEGLYPAAPARMAAMANLFPSSETEFFLALKNPVTLLQALYTLTPGRSYDQVMQGIDLSTLRWAPTVRRMVQSLQGRRLVLWRNEDGPLVWPEIVRLVAQMPIEAPLKEGLAPVYDLLSDAGRDSLAKAMAERDQLSIAARRDLCIAHLAQHALSGRVEEIVTLPGWTQEMVDEMTRQYHADIAEIAVLPGVEFLMP
ncbi:hypothetical protein [Paracoccus zhejiangensis]|uniref:Uncharacterized protein n=1 Tax=Paracoccus zhejiangensis TaxID=1077935 RepID=A0A2H5EYR7_9RHOB|nr:hypothetical protein [Paracoccus zhejiangensis]AUH64440.1 hypothetical protein CX676_09935 [Paracoccus zhejiangensis]